MAHPVARSGTNDSPPFEPEALPGHIPSSEPLAPAMFTGWGEPRMLVDMGSMIADTGNLNATVLGLVFTVEVNNHARKPLNNIGIARRSAVVRGCADALNNLNDFLLRFGVITADQDIAER